MVAKLTESLGMPWEALYGYTQAVQVGDSIYVSGQVSHDDEGNILWEGDMEGQMRQAYKNAAKLLAQFGAGIDNVVDEILFVTDMDSAFEARAKMKDEVYGSRPDIASTIVQIQRLALPPLMVEIRMIART